MDFMIEALQSMCSDRLTEDWAQYWSLQKSKEKIDSDIFRLDEKYEYKLD